MVEYWVYLETAVDGLCMAHVLSLTGCIHRANRRAECLENLPAVVAAHHAWLASHGEPAPAGDATVDLSVVEEVTGTGPFNPGDAAALFSPDHVPLTRDEMEERFRLMAHARADLLALIAHLPEGVLDWEPGGGAFSIRRIARHVGDAEQWYVSRLVPPDTLPHEWDTDEALPLIEFLEMERRTAVDRLRHLADAELAGVFYPTAWTNHPDEAWTARKVLRRFLEHELEHTRQVRQLLALRRDALVAELDAARDALLSAVALIPPGERASRLVCGDWTLHDVLAHIVAWEIFGVDGLRDMAAGRPPDVEFIASLDVWNATEVQARREQPWPSLWQDLVDTRRDLRTVLTAMDPADLWRSFPFPWGDEGTSYDWLSVYIDHDREHAEQLTGDI
ncbi:MAG: type II toxin-antitoxin system HicB family antitoxin [Anaerolineae bacterium]|nr:type II toxin-antitoxin system HicB family antitoxin [Anaerolineae bacterium]